jgi:hypothetical protein
VISVGLLDRAGFDVSPSGCADPMMMSSSLSTSAIPDPPTPRTTVSVFVATAVTRITSPVRVTLTRSCCAKYAPLSTTTDVAPAMYPAPLLIASNRGSNLSSNHLNSGFPVGSVPAISSSSVSGAADGSSSRIVLAISVLRRP